MGLSKAYIKFNPGPILGMVASRCSPVLLHKLNTDSDTVLICIVAVLENVVIWNVKLSTVHSMLMGNISMVTSFCLSHNKPCLAVGYNDGIIKLWNLRAHTSFISLNGHTGVPRVLAFSSNGLKLASGGDDGDIIMWDVINYYGLFRLKGHTSIITTITFLCDIYLVSTSKDCLVKIWNLVTKSCFQTIIDHDSEILSNVLICDTYMITGSLDGKLRIFSNLDDVDCSDTNLDSRAINSIKIPVHFKFIGFIDRGFHGKVTKLFFNKSASFVIVKSNSTFEYIKLKIIYDSIIETPRISIRDIDFISPNEFPNISSLSIERKSFVFLRKKSFDFDLLDTGNDFLIALNLGNNQVEILSIDYFFNSSKLYSLSQFHHNDVRCLSFSSDSQLLAAGSSDEVRIWNPRKEHCLLSIRVFDVLSCCFIISDKYLIVGTSFGLIHFLHVYSSTLIKSIHLHSDAIWSVISQPNSNVIATCSSDKILKLTSISFKSKLKTSFCQDFGLVEESLLYLPEEILFIKYSYDAKLLAVSLLDNTVKVFLVASMKIILSLYGHNLPVLCIDISHDCNILASGSVDRSVKIWSLDFGNCLHSIYAHDDAIMSVVFIPSTHQLFSASRDKTLKLFDLDVYQQSYTLRGHHDRIYSIAISPDGNLLASCSHDLSVRIWQRSYEQYYISEKMDELIDLDNNIKFFRYFWN